MKYFENSICVKCKNLMHEYENGLNLFYCDKGICEINPYESVVECFDFEIKED